MRGWTFLEVIYSGFTRGRRGAPHQTLCSPYSLSINELDVSEHRARPQLYLFLHVLASSFVDGSLSRGSSLLLRGSCLQILTWNVCVDGLFLGLFGRGQRGCGKRYSTFKQPGCLFDMDTWFDDPGGREAMISHVVRKDTADWTMFAENCLRKRRVTRVRLSNGIC